MTFVLLLRDAIILTIHGDLLGHEGYVETLIISRSLVDLLLAAMFII